MTSGGGGGGGSRRARHKNKFGTSEESRVATLIGATQKAAWTSLWVATQTIVRVHAWWSHTPQGPQACVRAYRAPTMKT